ncbi:Uncharacterized protein SCF082_LOCUS15267, partial [Durusdinium trenchii]
MVAMPQRGLDEVTAAAMSSEVLRSFEEDFAWHLHREGQMLRISAAVLGFAGAGALTFLGSAALPFLSIGPLKVALTSAFGALGGSHWAGRQSELETRRQGVAKSWEAGANALVAIAGSFPPRPTIRRLKRIVKWAHRLLARPGALAGDWRLAVFIEVACAFAPWAQRVYFERHRSKSGGTLRYQSLLHLLPLYRFLQRSAAAQVAQELCSSLAARRGSGWEEEDERPRTGPPERRCLALATVLQTIAALETLDDVAYDRLTRGLDLHKDGSSWFSWMRSMKRRNALGRRQLQNIMRAGRAVLRPMEIRDSLTSIPPMVRYWAVLEVLLLCCYDVIAVLLHVVRTAWKKSRFHHWLPERATPKLLQEVRKEVVIQCFCIMMAIGSAVACGYDDEGQCIILPLTEGVRYKQASAGGYHSVLLRSDGSAVACGSNDHGQCTIPEGMSYKQ